MSGDMSLEEELEDMILQGQLVEARRRGTLTRLESNVVERKH